MAGFNISKGNKKKPKKKKPVKPIGFGKKIGGGTRKAIDENKRRREEELKDLFG